MAARMQRVVSRANTAGRQIAEWTPTERVLAGLCALSPAVMWRIDNVALRDSISDYYRMGENQLFYVPLAIAAMLFVVNGITNHKHWYNWLLGIALLGVILFNHDDFNKVHAVFATSFFLGNVVVMWWFSDLGPRTRAFRMWFVGPIVAILLAWRFFDGFNLFWAEQASLLVIAVHFSLDSKTNWTWYNAYSKGENPWPSPQARMAKATEYSCI